MAIKQLKDLDIATAVQSTDGIVVVQGGTAKRATVGDLPGASAPVTSVNSKTGAVVLSASDISAMATSHAANAITGLGASGTTTTVVRYDDARLSDARPASDVSAWAKAAAKPTYTYSEVGAAPAGEYSTDIHSNILALNAVSGINTGDQDLSGYSLTTHNHSLNNLTEKSYNSLTDKPSIPSVSGLLNESTHDELDHTGLTGVLALGTTGTTACAGNDGRLSDARPANGGNSATTSQTTFGRVRTDGINRGSYGSISISGMTNSWAGIDFTDFGVTLMIRSEYQGIYDQSAGWAWGFINGVLTYGIVPWARLSDVPAYALLASPTFTGTPSAPTAAAGANTTQLATTSFVTSAIAVATGAKAASYPVTIQTYQMQGGM